MKRIFTILSIFILLTNAACKDDEKMFSGETGIHFAMDISKLDSTEYTFTHTLDSTINITIPVEIEGYADKNVTFSLSVDDKNTTAVAGKHYLPLEQYYTIPQGSYSLDVPITLCYAKEMDSTRQRLSLIINGDGLAAGINSRQKTTIIITNQLQTIPDWDNWYRSYFGPYSKVKHRYILSEIEFPSGVQFEILSNWRSINLGIRTAYSMQMNTFFTEHTIYDENGNLIQPWL